MVETRVGQAGGGDGERRAERTEQATVNHHRPAAHHPGQAMHQAQPDVP